MIMWNGLDSTEEHMYSSGHWAELAARGISCLMVDCPGSGEALRLQGLTARVETEGWASACVDYLESRDDVGPARIGLVGWSLGGYFAPRAAAFEKRLALVDAWGQPRLGCRAAPPPGAGRRAAGAALLGARAGVWGHDDDLDAFADFADSVNLDGVAEKITVPFLICHGENDRQIPVAYAHRSYEQAVTARTGT